MNFSKNLAIVVLILLAINSIVASLLRLICVFWIPILFVDFAIYIGISACINLVILLAITSIAVWEIIKKILRWSEQKKEEMELADREAEEFFYQMQNISVDGDADRDFLKGAIREIVSDILLEKNIINRQYRYTKKYNNNNYCGYNFFKHNSPPSIQKIIHKI